VASRPAILAPRTPRSPERAAALKLGVGLLRDDRSALARVLDKVDPDVPNETVSEDFQRMDGASAVARRSAQRYKWLWLLGYGRAGTL